MNLIKKCILKLKKQEQKIKIALIEGHSKRMIAAAKELKAKDAVELVLIFETKEKYDSVSSEVQEFQTFVLDQEKEMLGQLAKEYETLRRGKETYEQSLANMHKGEFFAAMLLNTNKVDGALGGVHLPTSSILKAAFKAVGPKEGIKTISSVMVMAKENETYLFGDISVNPNPKANQLADIAQNANDFAKSFDIEEKVAFLSFSTSGSASNHQTKKVFEATENFNQRKCSKYPAIGEVQFDTAFVQEVKDQKYKYDHNFDGTAKIFIFPDLNSGNIGYKIAQRMGGLSAMGPIITGLKKPYNDLSRGSTVKNIIESIIITAIQALSQQGEK